MSIIKEEAAPAPAAVAAAEKPASEVAPVEIDGAAAAAAAPAKNSPTSPKPKPKQAGGGKKGGQRSKTQDSTALMASLTPLMALMAEAAELDLATGRFRDDSQAAKLTWQRRKSRAGSASLSVSSGQRHPLEPTMLELVGLFYLPWATAFISDLDWPEVRELSTQLLEYTGCQELMYLDVALHPVRKYGGLQYYPAPDSAGYGLDMSKLRELCERKNFKMPLTGWHGLAPGLHLVI